MTIWPIVNLLALLVCVDICVVVSVLLDQVEMGKEDLLETVLIKAFGSSSEHVLVGEEVLDLLWREWKTVFHNDAAKESFFRDIPQTGEVKSIEGILGILIHLLELKAELVSDCTAEFGFGDARTGQRRKGTYFF